MKINRLPALLCAALVLRVLSANAQNHPPVIGKAEAFVDAQKKQIVLKYQVDDAEQDRLQVSLIVEGEGKRIHLANTGQATGDLGFPVRSGKRKITWKYGDAFGRADSLKVQLVVHDRQSVRVQDLVDQVDSNQVYKSMLKVYGIRNATSGHQHLAKVKDTIHHAFLESNLSVRRQAFTREGYLAHNIIGRINGQGQQPKTFILGAHFDTVEPSPGADDNASGVAGMLEAMRILSGYNFNHSIEFAAFDLEEAGKVGSKAFLESQSAATRAKIGGYINFDMIGYCSQSPNSQYIPPQLAKIFPEAYGAIKEDGFRANFILNVSNQQSDRLRHVFDSCANTYAPALKVVSVCVPSDGKFAPQFFRASDYVSFWDAHIQALSLGDTGDVRNKNYHSGKDTLETINFTFVTDVVRATIATIVSLAEVQHSTHVYSTMHMVRK